MRERLAAAALLAVALIPLPGAAVADDQEPFSLASLGLKGTAVYKNFSHFDTTRDDPQLIRNEGLIRLEFARRLAPWLETRVVGHVQKDDDDLTDGVTFQIQDKDPRRSVLDLKEAVLRLRGGPLDVALGKQIFAWGAADAFNPTDNLNAYDYMDPFDSERLTGEKLGLWSAAFRLTAGATTATFVVVPAFVPSRVPLPRSRWVPETPTGFVVGEMAMLTDGRRSAHVVAESESEVLVVSDAALERFHRRFPFTAAKLYRNIASVLSERLRDQTEAWLMAQAGQRRAELGSLRDLG